MESLELFHPRCINMPEVNHIPDAGKMAKCPMCGNTLQMDQWKWPECTKCPFRCALSDLPRITAAMELARAVLRLHKDDSKTAHQWEFFVEEAEKRVLEVLK